MRPGGKLDWTAQSPYDRFFDFIAPDADRFAVLFDHVQTLDLNTLVVSIEGNRHFFLFPDGINLKLSPGDAFPFRGETPVVLTAHYDRVDGSPGANDNSAAVFMLIKAALRLRELGAGKWIIIFTDKEELLSGEGIQEQGSYSLAIKLCQLGLENARVFNFDACGTGETFVFSSTADYLLEKNIKPSLRKTSLRMKALREMVFDAARNSHISHVLSVPTPFSDDAGFLQGGIPSQTVTILPSAEVAPFASMLRKRPGFADAFIAGLARDSADRRFVPETWRCINGPMDSYLRLTPGNFEKVVRFAVELCKG
ncbi:MAG: M28 family metallopeptidase [Treponema sp.]|nr:M28 family metallopeptidase [Treponema sp.]